MSDPFKLPCDCPPTGECPCACHMKKCEHGNGINEGPCGICDAPENVKYLRRFVAFLKDNCWPIEPKESCGAFDRDETLDALIQYFVAADTTSSG